MVDTEMTTGFSTIDRDSLAARLQHEPPNNDDRKEGYALVNVLEPEVFVHAHIAGSINIPQGRENLFEQRFDKDKQIIVYCASLACQASPTVAQELARRGFTDVYDYEGGMKDWKHGRQSAHAATHA